MSGSWSHGGSGGAILRCYYVNTMTTRQRETKDVTDLPEASPVGALATGQA
jgi:hypothetical protein